MTSRGQRNTISTVDYEPTRRRCLQNRKEKPRDGKRDKGRLSAHGGDHWTHDKEARGDPGRHKGRSLDP